MFDEPIKTGHMYNATATVAPAPSDSNFVSVVRVALAAVMAPIEPCRVAQSGMAPFHRSIIMARTLILAASAVAMALASGAALADSAHMDQIVDEGGIQTVCTGVGSAKDDPQFQNWPAQIEFSNEGSQYLSGVHIAISQNGNVVRDTVCNGPWFLVKGTGTYQVKGSFEGMQDKTGTFTANGPHKRIVLQFAKAPNQ